jgi:hypothetical protein
MLTFSTVVHQHTLQTLMQALHIIFIEWIISGAVWQWYSADLILRDFYLWEMFKQKAYGGFIDQNLECYRNHECELQFTDFMKSAWEVHGCLRLPLMQLFSYQGSNVVLQETFLKCWQNFQLEHAVACDSFIWWNLPTSWHFTPQTGVIRPKWWTIHIQYSPYVWSFVLPALSFPHHLLDFVK